MKSKSILTAIVVFVMVPVGLAEGDWPETKLVGWDTAADDWFGYSVAISGNYAIIGVPYDDDKGDASGSAYIFKREGANWYQQAKLTASDGAAGDRFGQSVSIAGEYAIVGAYCDGDKGDESGSAYIFERDGSSWIQEAKLVASDGEAYDFFGYSVAIDGVYAIVGAAFDDHNIPGSGSAYIFKRDVKGWFEQDKLVASVGVIGARFGNSVAISGEYAIVGATLDNGNSVSSGAAYIFKQDSGSWLEQAKLVASDGVLNDWFGFSVSISGDYAIVGAQFDDDDGEDSGSAYVFKRDGSSWLKDIKFTAWDGTDGDAFGYSVSMSGNYVIVGAVGDDDNGEASGSAYIFKLDGSSWLKETKLIASDGAYADSFGCSISMDGAFIVVGALGKDEIGLSSGAAYIFGEYLCPSADLTGDCFVNMEDFAIMAQQWLTGNE